MEHFKKIKKNENLLNMENADNEICVIGRVLSEVFKSNDNGYSVYTIDIKKKIETNEDGKYLKEENITNAKIRATGYFDLSIGQTFKMKGTVSAYKGERQLSLTSAEYIEPTSEDGIIAFLSSGLFKGIGEKTAEKIVKGYATTGKNKKTVKGFGEKTLEVIKTFPKELTKISGITKEKAEQIHETYLENIEFQNTMIFLQKYNITPNKIAKIYKEYREEAVKVIKDNPYKLSEDIKGFGFKTCDEIARKMGLDPHSRERIKSGTMFTLQDAKNEGHCYLTESQLLERTMDNLSIIYPLNNAKGLLIANKDKKEINIKIDNLNYTVPYIKLAAMVEEVEKDKEKKYKKDIRVILDRVSEIEIKQILDEMLDGDKIKRINHNNEICIYIKEIYEMEQETAKYIRNISRPVKQTLNFDDIQTKKEAEKHILDFEKNRGIQLEEKQKEAIFEAFDNNFMVLIGNAGTGKTTTVEAIIYVLIKMLDKKSLKLALTAPTGKASKRLTEVTGYEAKTIHRTLEFKPPGGFSYNSINKLPYNLLIVDEASMLDLSLAHSLFSAVDTEKPCKVILIGDTKQLPSIGAGDVLTDIIRSGKIKTVELDVIKRQAENSGIITNAHNVVKGKMIETDFKNNDFFVILEEDKIKVQNKILVSISNLLRKKEYYYTIDDIQVVCPQRTSEIGTIEFNKKIQELVNPPEKNKKEIKRGDVFFRVGDKVIHTENNYEAKQYYYDNGKYYPKEDNGEFIKGVFNGETGNIVNVVQTTEEDSDVMSEHLVVEYDDFFILYSKAEMHQLDHAYALTVHKLQGSQKPVILMPVSFRNYIMLYTQLFYTGITRAKEKCCIIGEEKAIQRMIKNTLTNKRNTMLKDII